MLSVTDVDFGGGELDVGGDEIGAQQGDMYVYPAAVVHRVRPLTYGRRLTLVIALEEANEEAIGEAIEDAHTAAGAAATMASDQERPEEEHTAHDTAATAAAAAARRRVSYFAHAEASFERLVKGALAGESKVHILHGEFLEGAGRAEEARAFFLTLTLTLTP